MPSTGSDLKLGNAFEEELVTNYLKLWASRGMPFPQYNGQHVEWNKDRQALEYSDSVGGFTYIDAMHYAIAVGLTKADIEEVQSYIYSAPDTPSSRSSFEDLVAKFGGWDTGAAQTQTGDQESGWAAWEEVQVRLAEAQAALAEQETAMAQDFYNLDVYKAETDRLRQEADAAYKAGDLALAQQKMEQAFQLDQQTLALQERIAQKSHELDAARLGLDEWYQQQTVALAGAQFGQDQYEFAASLQRDPANWIQQWQATQGLPFEAAGQQFQAPSFEVTPYQQQQGGAWGGQVTSPINIPPAGGGGIEVPPYQAPSPGDGQSGGGVWGRQYPRTSDIPPEYNNLPPYLQTRPPEGGQSGPILLPDQMLYGKFPILDPSKGYTKEELLKYGIGEMTGPAKEAWDKYWNAKRANARGELPGYHENVYPLYQEFQKYEDTIPKYKTIQEYNIDMMDKLMRAARPQWFDGSGGGGAQQAQPMGWQGFVGQPLPGL
uniref:Uncharacterized protein n=3 Tax=viral metagenome TaxID=1070528 RepID=A0A6M3LIG5_9ZZZZ